MPGIEFSQQGIKALKHEVPGCTVDKILNLKHWVDIDRYRSIIAQYIWYLDNQCIGCNLSLKNASLAVTFYLNVVKKLTVSIQR